MQDINNLTYPSSQYAGVDLTKGFLSKPQDIIKDLKREKPEVLKALKKRKVAKDVFPVYKVQLKDATLNVCDKQHWDDVLSVMLKGE
jgi:hypothetical protein